MKKYYYLLSLLFIFVIPTIIAGFYIKNINFIKDLIPFVILVTIIGSIWDIWATKHGRKDSAWLWQFNSRQTLGIKIVGLPIEEYLFYVSSSVYVIFMWEGIKQIVNNNNSQLFLVIPILAIWTLICILLPYKFGPKGDKLIG